MKVTTLTISQLKAFVESEAYRALDVKPITPERARSQAANPSASPNDVALIFASKESKLLSFIGLLPFKAHGETLYANTCWWASAEGKSLSMTLFLAAVKATQNRFVIVDGTPHTKTILEATKLFHFTHNQPAFRGFCRFYFAQLFKKKYPQQKILISILKTFDWELNLLWNFRIRLKLHETFHFETIAPTDKRLDNLIEMNASKFFFRKEITDFEWIETHPWLTTNPDLENEYPFSHGTQSFHLQWNLAYENGALIGALLLSNRNGHLRIPYFYCNKGNSATKIAEAVEQIIRQGKYLSVTTFDAEISTHLSNAKMLYYKTKRFERVTCFSKELANYYDAHPKFQDGDGDSVFTG
jgi:hypothetical protein